MKYNIDLNSKFGTIKKPLESDYKDGLTVCMIVRNEENNILECLESLIPVADQIVVNDTGSKDQTGKIVRNFKHGYDKNITRIFADWEDDFALARNQSIEMASHKWILWIDADDRIPKESIEGINLLKTAPLSGIFGFNIINTNDGQPIGTRFVQIRMFPNHPKIRFERRIHEQVMGSAAELGLYCHYIPAKIYHTGYENREERERKAIRNIRISNLEPELIGADPSFTMSLADSHFTIGEWERGISIYEKCLKIPNLKKIQSDIHTMVPYNIAMGLVHLKQYKRAIVRLEESFASNKHNLNAIYYLARLHVILNDSTIAERWFKLALETPYKPGSIGIDVDSIKMFSFIGLSNIYIKDRKYKKAIKCLLQAKRAYPNLEDLYTSLSCCYVAIGRSKKSDKIMSELAGLKEKFRLSP